MQSGTDARNASTVARLAAPVVSIVGQGQRVTFETDQPVTLGRHPECEVRLTGNEVSRNHASAVVDSDGTLWLTDLESKNGTFVDGHAIHPNEPTPVTADQSFTLGGTKLDQAFRLEVDPDVVIDLDHRTTTVMPHRPLTIGRALDNALQLNDLLVSRHHARATPRTDGSFQIEDLDSHNGTFVDGRRVRGAIAREGSLITVGRSSFRVERGNLVHWTQRSASLQADHLSVTVAGGKKILDDVSFDLPSNQLMAVIGPSGAGKTTLLRALTGSRPATAGHVWCDGRDLYRQYSDLKHRIGVVPQDDIVHTQLTVSDALMFAAELRFPDDLENAARQDRVTEVIDQLQLTEHRQTRVSQLSGGQRKRVSVAMELLTEPSLIFLDEPTSGLDPGLDKAVMQLLRTLCDTGRTVVVITHSTANLNLCDRVLLLAPGGSVAYDGPHDGLLEHFGATDMADVFHDVSEHPRRHRQVAQTVRPQPAQLEGEAPPRRSMLRQFRTVVRRQLKIVAADRSYALATLVLPAILALMTLAISGSHGFRPAPEGINDEATRLLVIMLVGAAFMGSAATIRELVAERAIFLRERAVGLSPGAYLTAKLGFAAVLTFIQSFVLVGLVLLTRPAPRNGLALPGPLELVVAIGLTALASACISLLLSAWVGNSEQVMPALVVMVMAQLVLCGSLIDVTGRAVLSQLAWLAPARWGFAAAGATVDLHRLDPTMADDALWRHTLGAWTVDVSALIALCVVAGVFTLLRLQRTRPNV